MHLDTITFRKDLKHPQRYGYGSIRNPRSIKSILIHTTNNPRGNTDYRSEARFLRDSGDVSIQYVVSSHDSTVAVVLPDTLVAWHSGDCLDNDYENASSIGIEIAWTINKGPLPPIAIDNVTALVRALLAAYPWISKIDTHRAQARPKGRKSDPSGWDDKAFYAWRDQILSSGQTQPAMALLTEDSPVTGPPTATMEQCIAFINRRDHGEYTDHEITTIFVPTYFEVATSVGINPVGSIARAIVESDNFDSALAQRRDKDGRHLRNFSGIGVTEAKDRATLHYRLGCVWDADVGGYRPACQFVSAVQSIRAQIGREAAYAIPPSQWTDAQKKLIAEALEHRQLTFKAWGSAPTFKTFGAYWNLANVGLPREKWIAGWAWDGKEYGKNVVSVANAIRGS